MERYINIFMWDVLNKMGAFISCNYNAAVEFNFLNNYGNFSLQSENNYKNILCRNHGLRKK